MQKQRENRVATEVYKVGNKAKSQEEAIIEIENKDDMNFESGSQYQKAQNVNDDI